MSEKSAYVHLLNKIVKPGDRIDRVENVVLVGMPDVNFCIQEVEGWIEIKQPKKLPKREGTPILGSNHKVSQDQKNWFLRQAKAGGNAYIYVKTDIWAALIGAQHADEVNDWSLASFKVKALWFRETPIMNAAWQSFREILINGK